MSGVFRTRDEARAWVAAQFGIAYTFQGMHSLLTRWGFHPKAPRPNGGQSRSRRPSGLEKRGLAETLAGASVTQGALVLHADELRLGLHGQVRRVWGRRVIKVVQRRQIVDRWRYLLLWVDAQTGTVRWQWLERLRQDHLKPVLAAWRVAAVIWDSSGAHQGKRLADLPTRRVFLPPYSPELNLVERVFEGLRRRVEGRVYDDLDAKQAIADADLQALAADPARVSRLCGWDWIRANFDRLPPPDNSGHVLT